jgi:hypothetical protein
MGRCLGTFMNETSFYDSWVREMGVIYARACMRKILLERLQPLRVHGGALNSTGLEIAARSHLQLGLDIRFPS